MMNKYKDFFENIIGFDKFIELRIFGLKSYPISFFPKNYKELQKIINKYKMSNIYCGVNPRKQRGRKNIDVSYRKNIVFDVEAIKNKRPLSDLVYMNKLKAVSNFIFEYLYKNFSIKPTAIVESGRGLHVYYTIQKLDIKYQEKYIKWYNSIIKYINENNPYKNEIKADPPVKDLPRIFGCPGTVNVKYLEKPVRKIIYLDLNTINYVENVLKNLKIEKVKMHRKSVRFCSSKIRYNNKTIFKAPEVQIFKHKPIPGTGINNKLRLALKLLMNRDGVTNTKEINQYIAKLGYPYKDMSFNDKFYKDYQYNEQILNNYVINNIKWSNRVGYLIPYKLKEEYKISRLNNIELDDIFEFKKLNINNYYDLVRYILKFNNKFCKRGNNEIKFYSKALKKNIYENIKDEEFKKFMENNKLIDKLKYII